MSGSFIGDSPRFKVWDLENKCWFKPVYNALQGQLEEILISLDGRLCLRHIDGIKDESTFAKRFKVCRWLYYYDANGIEIYEGDFILWRNYSSLEQPCQKCGHIERGDAIMKVWLENGLPVHSAACDEGYYTLEKGDTINVRVIGNMFESPDIKVKINE
jgi:YopX protein